MTNYFNKQALQVTRPLMVVAIMLFIVAGCGPVPGEEVLQGENAKEPFLEEVVLNGHAVMMELALTPEQRARGLMGREALADDEGMLFVFPDTEPYPAAVSFWMKDCLIPIDVIFISREGEIVSIHEMEPPEPGTPDDELKAYPSGSPVQFAIEVRGGLAEELDLGPGDIIELQYEDLMEMAK